MTKIERENQIVRKMIEHLFNKIKTWLQSLSFRTGVIVLLCCIPFYILSFAQMLLPISAAAKGVLWTILFGLAKTCQYGGLTILGVEGYNRMKNWIRRKKISCNTSSRNMVSLIVVSFILQVGTKD